MSVVSNQYSSGQATGLSTGLIPVPSYSQTTSVQRSAEFHNPSHAFGVPESASSSSQDYRVTTSAAEPVLSATNYRHHTAHNRQAFGGASVALPNVVRPPQRQSSYRKQVIRLPDQPPRARQVRHRLPTPEPDILERIYQQRVAAEIIEEITEIPTTPPPIIQERTVVEPSGPPQVIRRVVRVPPRGTAYGSYPQYGGSAVPYAYQYASPLPQATSYASVQSASPQYYSPAPAYSSYSPYAGRYGSYAAPQQPSGCSGCSGAGAAPVAGANCFYV